MRREKLKMNRSVKLSEIKLSETSWHTIPITRYVLPFVEICNEATPMNPILRPLRSTIVHGTILLYREECGCGTTFDARGRTGPLGLGYYRTGTGQVSSFVGKFAPLVKGVPAP